MLILILILQLPRYWAPISECGGAMDIGREWRIEKFLPEIGWGNPLRNDEKIWIQGWLMGIYIGLNVDISRPHSLANAISDHFLPYGMDDVSEAN